MASVGRIESEETPALAEEREPLLWDDPEPLPMIGRIGVGGSSYLQVSPEPR